MKNIMVSTERLQRVDQSLARWKKGELICFITQLKLN